MMSKYQNKAVRWAAAIAIAVVCWTSAFPALAATENFELKSNGGYRLEADFTYQEPWDEAKKIDSLKTRFYNPDGEAIASYDNIVNGEVRGDYFQFDYDLDTHQPIGEIDLGGESAGDIYLKGSRKAGFSWLKIMPTGEEITVDSEQ